jgi:hypothetical protein
MARIDDTGSILAPLQVIDYKVDSLNYSPGPSKRAKEKDLEAILDLSFLPDTREGDAHGMSLTLELRESDGEENQEEQFRLSITVIGHFRFIDDPSNRPSPEQLMTFFFTTSGGTLYGIVREKGRAIASQSSPAGINIPVINLGAVAEGLEEEEDVEHFVFEEGSDGD